MIRVLLAIAVAIDQLLGTIIVGLLYLLALAPAPNPDETISSIVGRNAVAGKRWALIAERVIDRLFWLLGDGPNHCARSIEWNEIPPR
jgi:hypothetical protein